MGTGDERQTLGRCECGDLICGRTRGGGGKKGWATGKGVGQGVGGAWSHLGEGGVAGADEFGAGGADADDRRGEHRHSQALVRAEH